MSDARPKASGPSMCKICNHAHWMRDPHVFGSVSAAKPKKPAVPTLQEVRDATAALERAFPSEHAKPRRASPAPVKKTLAVLGELVADASERIASKPKRKKPMVAKDGTNRGRPTNPAKGKAPFDKKAHDRAKAKERRAANKAAAVKP